MAIGNNHINLLTPHSKHTPAGLFLFIRVHCFYPLASTALKRGPSPVPFRITRQCHCSAPGCVRTNGSRPRTDPLPCGCSALPERGSKHPAGYFRSGPGTFCRVSKRTLYSKPGGSRNWITPGSREPPGAAESRRRGWRSPALPCRAVPSPGVCRARAEGRGAASRGGSRSLPVVYGVSLGNGGNVRRRPRGRAAPPRTPPPAAPPGGRRSRPLPPSPCRSLPLRGLQLKRR